MGAYMQEHDIHVGSFQEGLNRRFAPSLGVADHLGGLDEMVALQKEFEVFKEGRRFGTSLTVLGVGGALDREAQRRFHLYLASLRKLKSNVAGKNGDAAIVQALVQNLASKKPLPVFFQPHDCSASADQNRVLITAKARPVFYIAQDYLVVSLPVGGTPAATATLKARKKS